MQRIQTVTYALGLNQFCRKTGQMKPMIRVANYFLLRSNFHSGDKVRVEYGDGIITITKENSNELIPKT